VTATPAAASLAVVEAAANQRWPAARAA